jgi:hypothetical protein
MLAFIRPRKKRMRTIRFPNTNSLQNLLLIGLGLSVLFTITVIAFIFGTQWTNFQQQPNIPNIPAVNGPVTQTPITLWTETPVLIDTPSPTPEHTPTNTPEVLPATSTANSTPTSSASATTAPAVPPTATSTSSSLPADWAKLVQNNQPIDGAYFAPKAQFKKVWTIKNIGTTTWTTDYDLVFVSGTAMTDKRVIPLEEKVKPGKTIEITIKQTAPGKPGTFQGFWMLRNSKGNTFGVGSEADLPLIVKINVLNVNPGNTYDFLLNHCEAEWWNSKGQAISCPGEPNRITGFVLLDTHPVLENGKSDQPILWVHPDNKTEGVISGKYPVYTVKNGDHFKARVGCISSYTKCNITFKLLYKTGNNPNQLLGSWQELYGGGITTIDVNLSHLAGQQVQFILRMICTNNNPDHAQGFWMTPRIVNIAPQPTPTPTMTTTPMPTPTETPTPTPTETLLPEETPTDTPEPPIYA